MPKLVDPCCDCGIREAEYKSLGGLRFCKKCADEIGLVCGERNRIKKEVKGQDG